MSLCGKSARRVVEFGECVMSRHQLLTSQSLPLGWGAAMVFGMVYHLRVMSM